MQKVKPTPFGLSDDHLEEVKAILREATEKNQTLTVWVFGSRARGDFKPHSDLDLLLEACPPFSDPQINKIKNAFEQSAIPIKVDVVPIGELFSKYKKQVEVEKVVFFATGG